MASQAFNKGIKQIQDRTCDYLVDTITVMLMKDSYIHNPDSASIAAISADEVSVAGYTRQTLGAKTITQDDGTDRVIFDGGDVATFGNLAIGQNVRGAVVFRNVGGVDANSIPIAFGQFGADTPTNGGSFGITWATTGIFYMQD